jgi:DNA-nicking Smr family endonuclease
MGRGRRKQGRSDQSHEESADKAGPVPEAKTSLGALLKAAKVEIAKPKAKPAPSKKAPNFGQKTGASRPAPGRGGAGSSGASSSAGDKEPGVTSTTELRMLNDAYAGARPLVRKAARIITPTVTPTRKRLTEQDREEELEARKRLAALVSGGVHFKVHREDQYIEGYRSESSRRVVEKLGGRGFAPEAKLDLHGERAARASERIASFVRSHHRRGARHLLIIVGKGLHSEDGIGVMSSVLIEALTQGLCAPLVRCFVTAHADHGGTGAVAVLLI